MEQTQNSEIITKEINGVQYEIERVFGTENKLEDVIENMVISNMS